MHILVDTKSCGLRKRRAFSHRKPDSFEATFRQSNARATTHVGYARCCLEVHSRGRLDPPQARPLAEQVSFRYSKWLQIALMHTGGNC